MKERERNMEKERKNKGVERKQVGEENILEKKRKMNSEADRQIDRQRDRKTKKRQKDDRECDKYEERQGR